MKYQQGLRDEDHLAAIMFNAMALIHYEEMIERGVLPAELNDIPFYRLEGRSLGKRDAGRGSRRRCRKPVRKTRKTRKPRTRRG